MTKIIKDVFVEYQESSLSNLEIVQISLYKNIHKLQMDLMAENTIDLSDIESFEEYLQKRFQVEKVFLNVSYKENTEIKNSIENDWRTNYFIYWKKGTFDKSNVAW